MDEQAARNIHAKDLKEFSRRSGQLDLPNHGVQRWSHGVVADLTRPPFNRIESITRYPQDLAAFVFNA